MALKKREHGVKSRVIHRWSLPPPNMLIQTPLFMRKPAVGDGVSSFEMKLVKQLLQIMDNARALQSEASPSEYSALFCSDGIQ
jgi:hypothetical protein